MEKPSKLPSGRWRARIFRDGKKVSLGTFATKKEAVEAQAHALVSKEEKHGNIKFWRYAEAHLNARRHDLASGSWENYVRSYRNHLQPTFGEKKLTDITPTMIRRWWTSMEEKPGPRKAAYFVLSNIMNQAVEDGEIPRFVRIKGASRDVSKKREPVSIESVQMLKMLSSDAQVAVILQVLVTSGLRIGEVLALDWADIDLENATLRVNKHLTRFGMKPGRKKHPGADVLQPVTRAAVDALTAWKEQGKGQGAVFRNQVGKRLSYYDWHHRWDGLRKAYGLEHVHTHDIRSTHLTEFGKRASLKELMERGGHGDSRSALIYQRPSVERQKQLVNELEGVF